MMRWSIWGLGMFLTLAPSLALADEIFVGGEGDTHRTIGAALEVAVDGDVVTVRAGTYSESLETRAPGVTLRAEPGGAEVLVTSSGRVLRVSHERFTLERFILDGQYGDRDAVQVRTGADGLTMRGVEVRRSGRDCIDMGNVSDILFEECSIHHCLASTEPRCASDSCRQDAHGITGAAVRRVSIRNTEIHTFSGDGVQFDPGRSGGGWSELLIEGSRIWLEPLPADEGGFRAGVVPGENALDTKTNNDVVEPAVIMIRDTEAWGFQGGLITNMSAFNLKENVQVRLDGVSVWDSEIAFRLRGMTSSRPRGAEVVIANTVIHSVDKAVRFEDGIDEVHLWQCTLGGGIRVAFDDQSAAGRIVGRNVLVLGSELPAELRDAGGLAVPSSDFQNAEDHDYHLVASSSAVDAGERLEEVVADRDGVSRPQGGAWDVGAYEFCPGGCDTPPPGGDAGVAADAGTLDAGAAGEDAAIPQGRPDGALMDAGAIPGAEEGCSCALWTPGRDLRVEWLLVGLVLFAWRRRR